MNRVTRLADGAGVLGASFAALCCAGTPLIVSALAAVGLGFLRNDAILWPLMFASLAVALWGFWRGRRVHGSTGPLVLAAVGAVALSLGVVVIPGFPARVTIWAASAALVAATAWNVALRRRCVVASRGPARMSARP
jgi:mercuric ion transport protein